MRFFYLILVVSLFCSSLVFSQAPAYFSYQLVLRDSEGIPLSNENAEIMIDILEGSVNGTSVFSESHSAQTNHYGLLNLMIGSGTILQGDLREIPWHQGAFFLKTTINGTMMGTSQLITVPFSMYAEEAKFAKSSGATVLEILTEEEIAMLEPEKGRMVFNKDRHSMGVFDGDFWNYLVPACNDFPTEANAGMDRSILLGKTEISEVVLQANLPIHGTAGWTIIEGDGGSFSNVELPDAKFTGLHNTTYLLRWTISTSCANSVDEVRITFTSATPGGEITDIDSNQYKTTRIGDLLWMAENLKTTRYSDGTPLLVLRDSLSYEVVTSGGYGFPGNDSALFPEYGLLYNYYAITDPKNLCPAGFRIPNQSDWQNLITEIGGVFNGGKLMETENNYWNNLPGFATNASGFSAIPAGVNWIPSGDGFAFGFCAGFITKLTEAGNAVYYILQANQQQFWERNFGKEKAGSVRCVKTVE